MTHHIVPTQFAVLSAQEKQEEHDMKLHRHTKKWVARFHQVMPQQEYLKLLEIEEDKMDEWFKECSHDGVASRITQKKLKITLKLRTLMIPLIKNYPALKKYQEEDEAEIAAGTGRMEAAVAAANGGPAVQISRKDPKVLWEDTKKWVDDIRKFGTNMQQFLHDAQIDENQLKRWYSAFDAASDITTKLRTHIKVVMDKKKKEDDANTRGPVFYPHMLHVKVAKVAATKAKECAFVPVVVPAGEPVQVQVHKPVPMPAGEPVQVPVHNDCKACKTGRHITHTCEKGGSRKQCKRKAPMAHQAEERDKSDLEQKLREKMARLELQLPGIKIGPKEYITEALMCALPSFGAMMVHFKMMANK